MEGQPPPPPAGRPPWFRLASIARQEAPPQPPQPPTRPPIFSALRSRADQPVAQPPPPPPLPAVSLQQPAAPSAGNGNAAAAEQQASRPSTAPSRPATPQSPKIIKTSSPTPPPSPKAYRPLPAAPNPEPEPKIAPTTPNQTGSIAANGNGKKNGSKAAANGSFSNLQKEEPAVEDKQTASETKKEDARAHPSSPLHPTRRHDDTEMRIITLAGKNVGAYMELGPSLARKVDASASGNHGGKAVGENSPSESAKPITTAVNSNVQSINNSWLVNSSCNVRSPGVHVKLVSRHKSKNGRPTVNAKENPK